MKSKVGELYRKSIVTGNKNEVTDNEIHISEVTNNEISVDDVIYFCAGTLSNTVVLNLSKKELITDFGYSNSVTFSGNEVNLYTNGISSVSDSIEMISPHEFKFILGQNTLKSSVIYDIDTFYTTFKFKNTLDLSEKNSNYTGTLISPSGKKYTINVIKDKL